jgi:hypothetical protein
LTPVYHQRRIAFAQEHVYWTWVDWSAFHWTDESSLSLFQNNGIVFVRRRSFERLHNDYVVPTVKFGAGGVTVWGAMRNRGPGFLHTNYVNSNAHAYIDILSNVVIPSAHYLGYGDSYFFPDDGARFHRARIVSVWKQEHDFTDIGQ